MEHSIVFYVVELYDSFNIDLMTVRYIDVKTINRKLSE